MSMTRVC